MRATPATPTTASDLAALVAAEERLERVIAVARSDAETVVTGARARAAEQAARIDAEITRERERIAAERAAATEAECAAIAGDARRQIARFEAVRDEIASELAKALATRLVELAFAEAVS